MTTLTEAEVETFTQGQCHAVALVISDLLTAEGTPHRLCALYADPSLEDSTCPEGTNAAVTNTEHIFVLTDDRAYDVMGYVVGLDPFLNYAYMGVYPWIDDDEVPLAWQPVTREWVLALADGGWQVPDTDAALPYARRALTTVNDWENRTDS